MHLLFISSTGDDAGQSVVTWAIARRLSEKGLRVGFFKPFGTDPIRHGDLWTDRDAILFKEVLRLEEALSQLCPYLLSDLSWRQTDHETIFQEVKSLVQEISKGKDALLIIGSKEVFFDAASQAIPDISLITELGADLILLNRYRETFTSLYSILSVCSLLKERVKGIIINRVPLERLEAIAGELTPFLLQKGVPITTVLPEDPILSCRSLREIQEILDGQILWGEKALEQPVGSMSVGSGYLEGKLQLFKRVYNKIVLLGPSTTTGDPPIRYPTIAGIILTGGRRPPPQALEAVQDADIPLLLVDTDTFGTIDRLERSTPSITPRDEGKVSRLMELMDRDGAFDRLFRAIGIDPA